METIEIYTDGACSGNPGNGGWGAVLIHNDYRKEISGAQKQTTNNQMEITAVIKALEKVKRPCNITIYSDSAYVVNAFLENWVKNWQTKNWVNSKKEPVKNRELWEKLLELLSPHNVKWIKVEGHKDNELNNRCDFLATTAIKEMVD